MPWQSRWLERCSAPGPNSSRRTSRSSLLPADARGAAAFARRTVRRGRRSGRMAPVEASSMALGTERCGGDAGATRGPGRAPGSLAARSAAGPAPSGQRESREADHAEVAPTPDRDVHLGARRRCQRGHRPGDGGRGGGRGACRRVRDARVPRRGAGRPGSRRGRLPGNGRRERPSLAGQRCSPRWRGDVHRPVAAVRTPG